MMYILLYYSYIIYINQKYYFMIFLFRRNGMKPVTKLSKFQQNPVQNVGHQLKEMVF